MLTLKINPASTVSTTNRKIKKQANMLATLRMAFIKSICLGEIMWLNNIINKRKNVCLHTGT
jgi:hypothetical protein